ncbi:MAG: HAD-IIA family hydrolase [Fimbriimonadaceae bacterium]|nr:MAG: HAD-IIA family hydrolase [Fimbriimonadaceae bacterium]
MSHFDPDNIKAVLLDLDGTVYRGSEACLDAEEAIKSLIGQGYAIRYLTNNSAARPEQITQKLLNLGIPCEPSWVLSSGMAATQYLKDSLHKTYSYVGEAGLAESLAESGLNKVPLAQPADAIVVGICRSFDYEKLRLASDSVRNGAQFIATNLDPTYPLEGGALIPGAGSIVAAVATASGVNPLVVGKPQPQMVLQACSSLRIEPGQAIVVGDRLDTDIACGVAAGATTWLVLTGVTDEVPQGQLGSKTLRELISWLD